MSDDIRTQAVALGDDKEIRDILVEICALTGMGFSAVARVTEARWIACQVDDRVDFGLTPGDELEVRKTICDEIRQSGTAVMIDNTETEGDGRNHPVPILYGFHSYVSIPILLENGAFFGTLCAIDPKPRTRHLRDSQEQLELLARRAAHAIDRKLADQSLLAS